MKKFYDTLSNYTHKVHTSQSADQSGYYPVQVYESDMKTFWWELHTLDFYEVSDFETRKPRWWPKK
jgi:hypothetical protein